MCIGCVDNSSMFATTSIVYSIPIKASNILMGAVIEFSGTAYP